MSRFHSSIKLEAFYTVTYNTIILVSQIKDLFELFQFSSLEDLFQFTVILRKMCPLKIALFIFLRVLCCKILFAYAFQISLIIHTRILLSTLVQYGRRLL